MAKIDFEGTKFEYDASSLTKYSVTKALTMPNDAEKFYAALDKIFVGKADEVAEKLDDSFEKMQELIAAIYEKLGGEAKNS